MVGGISSRAITITIVLLAGLTVSALTESSTAVDEADRSLRVATLNVHYLVDAVALGRDPGELDPVMQWERRDEAVVAVLLQIKADIVAFQEMETFAGGHLNRNNVQLQTVKNTFPEYSFGGTGDPAHFPATQPIMYRRDRFSAQGQGYFFFSPTPDTLYSDPWYGRYPSFASWVRLVETVTGRAFLVVNVHIDRERYRNQIRSSHLIVERIDAVREKNDTVVILGDFNAFRVSRVVRIINRGLGLQSAPPTGTTFHFYRGLHLFPAIDHVLYQPATAPRHANSNRTVSEGGIRAIHSATVRARPDGIWPSDHYPVVVDLQY